MVLIQKKSGQKELMKFVVRRKALLELDPEKNNVFLVTGYQAKRTHDEEFDFND